jgi:hypothetical protein
VKFVWTGIEAAEFAAGVATPAGTSIGPPTPIKKLLLSNKQKGYTGILRRRGEDVRR